MIACLPMYDRPELRWATDKFWSAIAAGLNELGIDAPVALTRMDGYAAMWTDPDLLVGMTCGKPYRDGLYETCRLVGTYDYALDGCPAGYYNSHIIVAADSGLTKLEDCAGRRFCYNGRNSESGYSCASRLVGSLDQFCGEMLLSGAHQKSAEMVAAGNADFAAIDAATWRYIAASDDVLAKQVRIIHSTNPVPGLPLITAMPALAENLVTAAAAAVTRAPDAAAALNIVGFVQIDHDAYLSVG